MTAPTAELDRLEADLAAIGGTFERRIGAGCQQLANDLLARVADLLSEADWLDVRGATLRQDLADLRARIAALEPPPLPPRLPGGARSGLPWASGERHGSVGRAALQAAQPAFDALRGRPADFEHLFLGSWDGTDVNGHIAATGLLGKGSALSWLAAAGVPVVLTVPLFPGLGLGAGLPDGAQRFADVANGLYDDYHTRLAGAVAAKAMGLYTPAAKPDPDAGLNPTAKPLAVLGVRIGWEANSTAYPWAHPFCGGDYAVWRQALARAQAPWRAAFPGALFALNFLRDFTAFAPSASFSVADLVGPDPSWFDALGADCYSTKLPTNPTAADVRAYLSAGTPARPQGPVQFAAAAAALGKPTEISEWAASRPVYPADDPSKDTPLYPGLMFDTMLAIAGRNGLAWEAYFRTNNPGTAANPASGMHEIVGASPPLPLTAAGYASRWRPAA
jgi:hypothetical protein